MGFFGGTSALRDALVVAAFGFSLSSGFFFGFSVADNSLIARFVAIAAHLAFLVAPAAYAAVRPTEFRVVYCMLVAMEALSLASSSMDGEIARIVSVFLFTGASDLSVVCMGCILSFSRPLHIKRVVCAGVCLAALAVPAFHALTSLSDDAIRRVLLALFFVCATAFAATDDGQGGSFLSTKDSWGSPREAWRAFSRGNGEGGPLFLAILAFCALFFFCFGLMGSYAASVGVEMSDSGGTMLFVAALAGLFLLFNEVNRGKASFNFVFAATTLLYVAALFVASAVGGMPLLLFAVLSTGAVVLRMPMWMYFSSMVQSDRVSPVFLYGSMAVFFTLQEFGRIVSLGIEAAAGLDAFNVSVFASAALAGVAALFSIACMAVFLHGRHGGYGAEGAQGSAAGDVAERGSASDGTSAAATNTPGAFESFCERYGLSEREREVALLYSLGRSAPYISAACHISESTVKSHLRHIYTKVGVNGKQEFLDVVAREAFADDAGPAARQDALSTRPSSCG